METNATPAPEAEIVWLGATEYQERHSTTRLVARKLREAWWMGAKSLGLGRLAACVALYFRQEQLVYRPARRHETPPTPLLDTTCGLLHGWVEEQGAGSRALLYFGGNGEDVGASLPWLRQLFPRHSLYVMPYRGFSGNPGRPRERHIKQDAVALFDKVLQRHRRIDVVGRSLGTGVAVHVAAERPVRRLALLTPYDSLRAVAQRHYPWAFVAVVLRDAFDSMKDAPRVFAPALLVSGGEDHTIPSVHAWRLRAALPRASSLHVEDAGHTDVLFRDTVKQALRTFLSP